MLRIKNLSTWIKLYEISLSSFYLGQGYDDDDDDEENNDTMVNWGFT